MEKNVLLSEIERLYEKYLKVWEDVCNIESPTKYKKGVDECGQYFFDRASEFGWQIEVLPQHFSGNPICITMNSESNNTAICLSGHIDTVHPLGVFGSPTVRFDDQKIYGPGVNDCKGGVVGALYAMEVLHNCGFIDRPVKLLIQTDEENSSKTSNKDTIKWICEKAQGTRAFLNLECYDKGMICVERKGIVTFLFKIQGVEAHSSFCAISGANAILEASHKIIELEKFKDNEGITASCNIISGGTAPNTVAGYCEVVCNVRFATVEQLEFIKSEAQKIADTVFVDGCETELEIQSFRVSMERFDRNLKLVQELNDCFEAFGLPRHKPSKRTGGSDAADVNAAGLTVVDSMGVEGEGIHSTKEFGYKESLKECAKRIVAAVCGLI